MAKRRKRNRGLFRPGPDPRRHVFTRDERSRGGKRTARLYCACCVTDPRWQQAEKEWSGIVGRILAEGGTVPPLRLEVMTHEG